MELPLYQKHLIDALRVGCKMWMDNLGNTTYHIKINNSVRNVTEQTISSLIWRGLIKMEGSDYVLTNLGITANIFSLDDSNKTLYSL